MKYVLFLILPILFIQNLYGNNPVPSPTFDDILKTIIAEDKYIFDDKNIILEVPTFADNPIQVPIFADAKLIKNAKQMILFADLNPIPIIVNMKLNELLPVISLNIKVAQETPLRALVLDDKNIWHIASKNIKSFGGGCSVASVSSSGEDFAKLLGKTKVNVFESNGIFRIKSSIFHPMETGLIFGNNEFYINKILVKADEKNIAEISTYSAISENPRFIFETKTKADNYKIEFYDIDGNQFFVETK
jgi:sulfur-oxidizing protein SoxY